MCQLCEVSEGESEFFFFFFADCGSRPRKGEIGLPQELKAQPLGRGDITTVLNVQVGCHGL